MYVIDWGLGSEVGGGEGGGREGGGGREEGGKGEAGGGRELPVPTLEEILIYVLHCLYINCYLCVYGSSVVSGSCGSSAVLV